MPPLQPDWSACCCLDTYYALLPLYTCSPYFTDLESLPPQTCLTESSTLSHPRSSSTSLKHSLTTSEFINFTFLYNPIAPIVYLTPLTIRAPWSLTPGAVP